MASCVTVLGIDPAPRPPAMRGSQSGWPAAARSSSSAGHPNAPADHLAARLLAIYDGIVELIERHRPDVLAVEDCFLCPQRSHDGRLGHARGVILLAGARAGVEIHEFAPATIKGSGRGRHRRRIEGAGAVHVDTAVATQVRSPPHGRGGRRSGGTHVLSRRTPVHLPPIRLRAPRMVGA